MKHLILTTTLSETPIDEHHQFVTVGQNVWGVGQSAKESLKNARSNGSSKLFITRVAPKEGFGVDPIDGSVQWSSSHDSKNCNFCSVGKGIRINVE